MTYFVQEAVRKLFYSGKKSCSKGRDLNSPYVSNIDGILRSFSVVRTKFICDITRNVLFGILNRMPKLMCWVNKRSTVEVRNKI